jgi:outer membrane protein assembly factor BamB
VEFPPTVASDGSLYITSENDYIYGLNPNGTVQWQFQGSHLHTPVSISPDGATVHFVSEDGYVYALNRQTGAMRWAVQLSPRGVYGTGRRIPVVYDGAGNLYFGWLDRVWSVSADGQLRWMSILPNGTVYIVGPAVAPDGTMYFTDDTMLAAVGMDGRTKWEQYLGSILTAQLPGSKSTSPRPDGLAG